MDGYTYRAPDECTVCGKIANLLFMTLNSHRVCTGCASKGEFISPVWGGKVDIAPVSLCVYPKPWIPIS